MISSNVINLYSNLLMKIYLMIQSLLPKREENKNSALANPIVIIVVIFALVMISWAIGEAICWAHGQRHFIFSTKIKEGYFSVGCS